MIKFLQRILIALFLTLNCGSFTAEEEFQVESYSLTQDQSQDPVHIKIINETESIQPGASFSLAIQMTIDKNWHTYSKNSDNPGMAPSIEWNLPEGFTVDSLKWENPKQFTSGSSEFSGYENEMFFLVDLTAPQTLNENTTVKIGATITWLACSDAMCLPGNTEVSTELPVKNEKPKPYTAYDFQKYRTNHEMQIAYLDKSTILSKGKELEIDKKSELEGYFGTALLFAFIGGMLLNLMPCVLPVLSLKIFSFVKMSGESRKLCFQHGIAFSVGVLISFWVLAGVLLILQAYGQSVGWGFQLQEPIFVAILASIIFALGLNLFGVMEIGSSITSTVGNINHKKTGLTSSFLSGILATAIATPCTGPFLGSAVGYAFTLPAISALAIFTVLGFGMAFPYLLLSAYPSLLKFIPKPGNWMITFKEIMGFLMMATTVWLLWVFSAQTSTISLIMLIAALFFIGISCWIYGKWGTPLQKKLSRRIAFVFALGFLALAAFTVYTATESANSESINSNEIASLDSSWEPFSPERIVELQKQGIPVFVDFTAKWCLICQTNHMSLQTDRAEMKFQSANVVRMKADWTKKDPVITQELKKFGRSSVPLYVLYGTNEVDTPKILPQVLTSDIVIDYLNEL